MVRIRENSLEIIAAENTYAHIERPLGVDCVRASCAIRAGSGVSWATSLFLYWAPGGWCQMGVIPRGEGRYYACVTTNGQRREHDLTRCRYAEFQYVAIELGEDCIRFLSRQEGGSWRNELVLDRPGALMGPPALLIVGKGFGLDAGTPDLDGDYGDRGPVAVSRVRELRVTRTDPDRLRMGEEERRDRELAGQDPLGRRILESGREPSYEAVAALLPAMREPREALGVKDGRYEIGVAFDGTIQLDTDQDGWEQKGPTVWFEIGDPPAHPGRQGCTKRLMEGYLPIVICEAERGGLRIEQTVFAWSEAMNPDADLWGYARLTITNAGPGERTIPIALRSRPETIAASEKTSLTVAAGQRGEYCVRVPSPAGNRTARRVDLSEFAGRLGEVASYWRRILQAGMRIATPERRVNDAYRAWLAYNFINVDKKGDVYEPHDGAGFYEQVYGYSAALYAHALDLWGYHEDARRYLESLLHFQRPDGLFFVNYGLPDHGSLLWALAEHYRLTGDAEWLRGVAPRMTRLGDWIVARRREATRADEGGRSVTHGLIRFTPYADYPAQTCNYYGDAYCCVGLEHAAAVFGEIGRKAEADRFEEEAARYRRDILASMDAAVVERDGMRLLPMEPDTRRLLESTQYRAGGYYGLVASMFLESGFLAPEDPRARLVKAAMERRHGLILGMAEFDGGVDHAYTYGYWLHCLRCNEVDRVLLGFYGTLAYGMGRETYGGVEVTQLLSGQPTPTMPHLYSGTQQLRLLRMMMIREEGEILRIGDAFPRSWLAEGRRIEIRRAPTSFGEVSAVIQSAADRRRLDAWIDPPTRKSPAQITLRLRHPSGKPITEGSVDGGRVETIGEDLLTIKPATGRLTIQVTYAP